MNRRVFIRHLAVDGTSHRTSTIARRTNRRTFLRNTGLGMFGAGLAMLSSACTVEPPQARAKLPRIGYLSPGPREAYIDAAGAFLEGLRGLGYIEGQTIAIEWRFASAASVSDAAWRELAADLVRLNVDVIVSLQTTAAALAAKAATSTIPIVANSAAPVESGLVASLSRPGGNVTGLGGFVGQNAKQLDLLRAVVPGLTRAAAFVDASNPANPPQWDEFQRAAEKSGVLAQRIELHSTNDLDGAFDLIEVGGAQALNVIGAAMLLPVRQRVVELALQHRLPSIERNSLWAEAGLLMVYGANNLAEFRHAADYVDKILRGAKPGDLPIEQPRVFDLVVNLKTAQALGLTIPADVAAQVTEWIQ